MSKNTPFEIEAIDEVIVTSSKANIARALFLIEESQLPLEVHIKTFVADRSDAQNRLSHLWYREATEKINDGISQRAYCKLHFGVGILKEGDSKTCRHFTEQYDLIIKPLTYEQKLQCMVSPFELPVTSLMNTKQFAKYLLLIEEHYSKLNVKLTRPDELYKLALMKDV